MSEFLSLITAPIVADGGDPFGADVNRDIDYERLKGEMGKLGDIDVSAVEELSVKILTKRSKDIRALAFLAYALLRKNDTARLADVFCALGDYCLDSFDEVFPRRENAKLAALRWFSESRFIDRCDNVCITAADAPHTARMVDALSKIRVALDKRYSDGAPPLSLLYRRAAEWDKIARGAAAVLAKTSDTSGHGGHEQSVDSDTNVSLKSDSSGHGANGASHGHGTDRESISHARIGSVGLSANKGGAIENEMSDTVVIKLSRAEYAEMLSCLQKLGTLLLTKE